MAAGGAEGEDGMHGEEGLDPVEDEGVAEQLREGGAGGVGADL